MVTKKDWWASVALVVVMFSVFWFLLFLVMLGGISDDVKNWNHDNKKATIQDLFGTE